MDETTKRREDEAKGAADGAAAARPGPETIADIVAEMRIREKRLIGTMKELIGELADRIEAATLWERADAATVAATQAVNMTKEQCRREFCPGNGAKMRAALESIADRAAIGGEFDPPAYLDEILGLAETALATPPRNCDRFGTADAARRAWWEGEVLPRVHGEKDGVEMAYHKWLFDTAEPEKGAKKA